jgi:DNA repair exonuclease SbcCD nuclease subunit
MSLRILLLADTHLGFDLPLTPRIRRRRRGLDFLANYRRALGPALAGEVDLVVHAGDVFDGARPHHTLVAQAFEPLRAIADLGIPVLVVPGNHERSRIPHARFAAHRGIRIFDRPRTFRFEVRGHRVALFGFPYERHLIRQRFKELVEATGWRADGDEISLLCVHHCFEGARVGPSDFTFRRGPDVIRCRDIPTGVAAVLTGHVHRHQVLTADLDGRSLTAPVIYPGSTERTAFAERDEPKGTVLLEVGAQGPRREGRLRWRFRELPTRPMVVARVRADGTSASELCARVRAAVGQAPGDAVLRLHILGGVQDRARPALAASTLRALAPPTMNVDVVLADEASHRGPAPGTR